MARFMRSDLGRGHSRLMPPTVVLQAPGTAHRPLDGHLFRLFPEPLRRPAHSRLRPPVVVNQPVVVVVYFGPQVTLAPTLQQPRRTMAGVRPPRFVLARPLNRPVQVRLAYSVRKPGRAELQPPTVVAVESFRGPTVHLAPSSRGTPKSALFPPVIPPLARPTRVTLTRIRPARTSWALNPPTAVLYPPARPLDVTLVRIRPPEPTIGRLGAPTVVLYPPARPTVVRLTTVLLPPRRTMAGVRPPRFVLARPLNRPVAVGLAYSVRKPGRALLFPPEVVTAVVGDVFSGPTVNLTYSRRPRARYGLAAPAIVNVILVVYSGPQVTLAPSRRQPGDWLLRPPAVVSQVQAQTFSGPQTTLVPARPQAARRGSHLAPPAVVNALPAALGGIMVVLAPSRRPAVHSLLRPPVTITEPQPAGVYPVSVTLAPSRRPRTLWFLNPPTKVLFPAVRPSVVSLAYSRRGTPKSRLRPAIIKPHPRPALTQFAYQRRGTAKYRLRGPVVVLTARFERPVQVNLTYSRSGRGRWLLRKPTVVLYPAVRPATIVLAPSFRGRPFSRLRPPAVALVARLFSGPQVTLAPSTRPVAQYGLAAPAVITPAVVYPPIFVWLATTPPKNTIWLLRPPTVVSTFVPPGGDVCGTDEPVAAVCGTDTPESRITGDDSASSVVCGSDEQST